MVQFTIKLKINMYVAISLECQPQKTKEIKEGNSKVADSGCTVNFMAVSAHLTNMQPTTNGINTKCTNGKIVKSTM